MGLKKEVEKKETPFVTLFNKVNKVATFTVIIMNLILVPAIAFHINIY